MKWVRSSVVERVPDKNEVEGSIPSVPTPNFSAGQSKNEVEGSIPSVPTWLVYRQNFSFATLQKTYFTPMRYYEMLGPTQRA